MCCRVNRCCFCIDHVLGVKVLAFLLMAAEVAFIVVGTLYLPQFLFAIAPTSSIGIFCDIFLLVAVFKSSRWFVLPWLIYIMILIVGLGLAAVLRVVIPLGALRSPDWLVVLLTSAGCLAIAGCLLYFWIVVLELFIRLGPPQHGFYEPPPTAAAAAGFYAPPGLYPGVPGGGLIPIQQYGYAAAAAASPPPASLIYQPAAYAQSQMQFVRE